MCLAFEARMKRLLLSAVATFAIATPAVAHHEEAGKSHAVATVTITEPVKADGKPLAPGVYEVWILDDRPDLGTGGRSDAQRVVELYQNGKMVARDVAEVFPPGERSTGTSGSNDARLSKATVEKLRGGEFLRISINDASGRYLIHLPTAAFSEPTPQPQAPSRIEVPPAAADVPPSPQK